VSEPESDRTLLVVEGVDKSFGGTHALRSVALTARAGEVHAVLGENGAGKSTLMKVLAGAIRPDAGSVKLAGRDFSPADPSEARARGVAIVYQELQLCPDLSVAENIVLGVEPTRHGLVQRKAVRARARLALSKVLGEDAATVITPERIVGELTAGDQQLVAIARALAQAEPRLLILDEPTASLSASDVERLFVAMQKLKAEGLCIVYISHFLEEVERIADRFTVLRDGKTVGVGVIGDMSMDEVVRMMVGGDVEQLWARSERTLGDVALELKGVAGRRKPVDASLELRRGEVVGIAGLVGAGRTELLRVVFGLDAVARGELRVGVHVGPASPLRRLQQGMGMLSEDRKGEGLAASMSIADNMTLSKLTDMGPWGLIWPSRQRSAAERWVERLSVRCRDVDQPVADLSGGNQQKVALARLLHHDVDVLLLDEPTRGIDVKSRQEVYRVIDALAAKGKAVLMVSSYLPELFGICDRIAVMRRGRLGVARPVDDLDQHGVLLEATGAS
jgi:ribose transport system ATP-binding protein